MKAKRLLFLVMAICLASGVEAQFYDSADDIYYYVELDENGQIKNQGQAYVFNFDGEKACEMEGWTSHVSDVKWHLRDNPNYYEDCVESTEYRLKFISGNTYQRKSSYSNKEEYDNYVFSYDRSILTLIRHRYMALMDIYGLPSGRSEWIDFESHYKKVDKSFFKVGRSRTPSGTMHE